LSRAVTVLGAGIVGICCALELQRRGYEVRLLDRRGPAEETSSGNAGVLSYSNITPLADPALLPRLPRLALNLDDDFLLHYPHALPLLPWFARFLRRCRRGTFLRDGGEMDRLTHASIELHREWIGQAAAEDLLNPVGVLKLYRSRDTFLRDRLERELLERCGVRHRLLGEDEIYQYEPDLKRVFAEGVLIEDSLSIRDPGELCRRYVQMFVDAGGRVERAAVQSLRPALEGWEIASDQGSSVSPRVVVCMGAWTPQLIAPLGYANPIAVERGYHTVFAPAEGAKLTRPFFDVDASYVMAPMRAGLRVTTGTNLTRRETRPDPRQLQRILPRVREAFPLDGELLEEPWMGRRPTVPDTLPIIGAAPRHGNLWLAFAHSHMGLTLGPITGRLIGNLISGTRQPFAIDACEPARYL
jgi:D-amino-acid dehydrogenase